MSIGILLRCIASNIYHSCKGHDLREEPLMIWGGGLWQKRGKKTQQLLAQEKKSSTASCRGKKTQREFSARGPPQIINGPSLRWVIWCIQYQKITDTHDNILWGQKIEYKNTSFEGLVHLLDYTC